MAVSVNASGSGTPNDTQSNGVTTIDFTKLTIAAGANIALCVIATFSNQGITSLTATWDQGGTNQAMTAISSGAANTGSGTGRAVMFGLIAPTTGNKTLRLSWTGSSDVDVDAIAFNGVDQTSVAVAFPNGTSATGNSSAPSVAITSAVGNWTVNVVANSVAGDLGSPTKTQLFANNTGANVASSASQATGASTVTHAWTITSGPGQWVSVGCDVLAAAASSTGLLIDGGHLVGHGLLTGSGKLAA